MDWIIGICIAAGVLLLLFLIYVFLMCPAQGDRQKETAKFFEEQKYYAHRGLHDGNTGDVPENSLRAFDLACKAGYGIELDVHITADGKLAVFHDDTLDRMCGVSGKTESKTLAELQGLTLAGTDQHIPSFEEVLDLVAGRAVLIVEIKGENTSDMRVCELTAKALDGYKGKWCMESFNPFYVAWFKKNRKGAVRGQLSCKMSKDEGKKNKFLNFVLENMLLSFLCRPDFIAYNLHHREQPSFKMAKLLGGYPVAWTARCEEDKAVAENEGGFKAVIFEGFKV
jgi:glycerophosphoryl diester phosphodiesterase